MKRKIVVFCLAILLSFGFSLGCFAESPSLELKAKSVILIERDTGKVLYSDNCDEKLPPASITKIMSLILILEAIERGDLALDTVVTASSTAASKGGSQIWLKENEQMTVSDLLKATVIASANDATCALAEAVAGSEETFVELMNKKAKELGMTDTTFKNCTGLDAEGHLTTAKDIAIMSAELIKKPLIKEYSTVWMDTLRDGKSELTNTNKLIRFYEGATGLKTGTTSDAGYCVSATAEKGGMELIAVVMAGETSNDRFNAARKLLDYGFANFSLTEIKPTLERDSVKVKGGTEQSVKIKSSGSYPLLLKKSEIGSEKIKIKLEDEVSAPVKKGESLGTAEIYIDKNKVGAVPIVAENSVEKLSFKHPLGWIFKGIFVL